MDARGSRCEEAARRAFWGRPQRHRHRRALRRELARPPHPRPQLPASVFSDPWVFLAVRMFVILALFAAGAVLLWFALSAVSHIRNRRWIRRLAGLEPQALYRGATEVEEALEEIYRVRDETRDRNAELITALDRTTQRVLDLEKVAAELQQENAALRAELAGEQRGPGTPALARCGARRASSRGLPGHHPATLPEAGFVRTGAFTGAQADPRCGSACKWRLRKLVR